MSPREGFGTPTPNNNDEITIEYGELVKGGADFDRILSSIAPKWQYSIDLVAISKAKVDQFNIEIISLINKDKGHLRNIFLGDDVKKLSGQQLKQCQSKLNQHWDDLGKSLHKRKALRAIEQLSKK